MRSRTLLLNAQELEIMKILWDRAEASVREVYDELSLHGPVAYTAVMTMLGVLDGKQYVEMATVEDRGLVYRPIRERQEVLGEMASEFVSRVFDGSGRELVESLIRTGELHREELDELSGPAMGETETVS